MQNEPFLIIFYMYKQLSTVSIIVAANLFDSMNDLKILASDMFISNTFQCVVSLYVLSRLSLHFYYLGSVVFSFIMEDHDRTLHKPSL